MSRQFRPNSGPVVGAEVATGHGAVGGEFDGRASLGSDLVAAIQPVPDLLRPTTNETRKLRLLAANHRYRSFQWSHTAMVNERVPKVNDRLWTE